MNLKKRFSLSAMLVWIVSVGMAQSNQNQNLPELLQLAENNYPLLKAKSHETAAAKEGIKSAKSSLLPSLDLTYQANLATYNNITGMFYPGGILPISGPPSAGNNYNAVTGSAAGALLNWTPITFGQRAAQINLANTEVQVREADASYEIFRHKVLVAQAYLDLLAATELVNVHQQNIQRAQQVADQVKVLVRNGLRPGVDSASYNTEVSRARIDLYNAQKIAESQRIQLTQLLGQSENNLVVKDTAFFQQLPQIANTSAGTTSHPLLELSRQNVERNRARVRVSEKAFMPKLNLWGTGYTRGSGINADGTEGKGLDGLQFSRHNYGLGFQLAVPLLSYPQLKFRINEERLLTNAGEERLRESELQLQKQAQLAEIALQNSLRIARETPAQLASAQYTFRSQQTRFNTGLSSIPDLVQAQYLLVRAQSDLKQSRIEVWKAILYQATVQGDLSIFLGQLK